MVDQKHIIRLKGKDFVLYAGLLDAATRAGLLKLTTAVVQIPTDANGEMAVVSATATFADGREFTDLGDCSPASTTPQLAAASLRMASTRAKARCLRDALNVGMCSFEELPPEGRSADLGEEIEPPARLRLPSPNGAALECTNPGCGKPLTKGQQDISQRAYGQPLCPACQKQYTRIG